MYARRIRRSRRSTPQFLFQSTHRVHGEVLMRYRGLSRRRRARTISTRMASLLSVGLSSLLLVSHIFRFNSATTEAAGPPPCLTVAGALPEGAVPADYRRRGGRGARRLRQLQLR